ncbi:MAG: M20 family metallo-hydrolase [Oscillospiraceae bacterium]
MLKKADPERMLRELNTLKTFDSRPDQEGTTRVLFSEEEMKAREYVKSLMRDAGMEVAEDAAGNIYGTLAGSDPTLPPVWSGSHIDTVLNAGMYDGMAGVIAAVEACRLIRESGESHRRSIVALVFSSEEPTRFGTSCIGSRAMAGHLTLEQTKDLHDDDGVSLYSELVRLGYTKLDPKTVRKHPGDVFASVELHVEQAPFLEELGVPVGIVEGICASTHICVTVEGQQEHAGSTPMNARTDALTAAAELILKAEELARSYGNTYTVATVGKVEVFPNASNVIPGRVSFTVDIRDIDRDTKADLTRKLYAYMDSVAALRGVRIRHEEAINDTPCWSDPKVISVIERSCRSQNVTAHKMISRAYHDSLLIAEFAPMAMIFVPSHLGISHDPAEYTDIGQIACGTDVLTETLLTLSNMETLD